jgi:hypothetical protein
MITLAIFIRLIRLLRLATHAAHAARAVPASVGALVVFLAAHTKERHVARPS